MEEKKPDWIIGDLYKQAWEIIKKHKVLWLFGMLASGTGVGFQNVIRNIDQKDILNIIQQFNHQQQPLSSEISRVLGTSTSYFSDLFTHLFSATPISFYVILGLEFLFLIAIGIFINLVYSAWATGSLLAGIQTAISGDKPTIKDSSTKAIPHIKPLIWLAIVPIVVLALAAVAIFLFLSLGLALVGGAMKTIFLFLLFIATVVFLIAVFILSLAQIWAQRQVVLDNKGGKEALFSSFKMVKKKFWAMLLLGIVNNILIVIVVGVPVGLIAGIFFGGLFSLNFFNADMSNMSAIIWIFSSLIIASIVIFTFFALFLPILGGIINTFKATVWSIAYNNIRGKYDK